ncbi:MAG: hypothetical protein ABR886_03095 [Dehalococcoidales bacterium]|jgi:hypothetical protein
MARDLFGNIIRTDLLGRKIPKKQIKRDVLKENKRRGKAAEDSYRMSAFLRGVEIERSPRGKDFIERKRDWFTGRVKRTTHVEIKSSKKAPLTKLQKKTRKKKSNYKVIRLNPLF